MALITIKLGGNSTPVAVDHREQVRSIANVVATVTDYKGCRWPSGVQPRVVDDVFQEGELIKLERGTLQIKFNSGAVALLQGPIQVRFDSKNSLSIIRGGSTFRVPQQAHGFTVNTTAAQIVDLGTEFGVFVSDSEKVTVRVKKGSVEVGPMVDGKVKQTHKKKLNAGDTIEIELYQPIKSIVQDKNKGQFTWPSLTSSEKHEKWKAYSEELKKDPDLVAYYTFENPAGSKKQVANLANATLGRFDAVLGDGEIGSTVPSWSTGRWTGKRALKFNSDKKQRLFVHDWQSAKVEDEFTTAMWIKLAPRQGSINTFISQNGPGDGAGGNVFLHLMKSVDQFVLDLPKHHVESKGAFSLIKFNSSNIKSSTVSGQWFHLACTIQTSNSHVQLYCNGKLVSTGNSKLALTKIPISKQPLVIGGRVTGGSCFNGWVDELALYRRALTAGEIKKMYENGKPY